MALSLPYPNTPLVGQPGDPVPINANFTALAQAIQAFDGSQIAVGTVVAAALNSVINPVTRDNLIITNFVSSGCVWSTVSGLSGTMSSGTLFINGNMAVVNGVISKTFTASKDTYIDIDVNGNVYYQEVSNGAASPSITANSIRIAKVVTSGAAITSIVQTGVDSLNNQIYPTNPNGYNSWPSWTPTWTVLTVGNGVNASSYIKIGKTIIARIQFTLGSTSSMGTGTPTFTLPVPAVALVSSCYLGLVRLNTSTSSPGIVRLASTTTADIKSQLASGTYLAEDQLSATVPGTWTAASTISGTFIYEAS